MNDIEELAALQELYKLQKIGLIESASNSLIDFTKYTFSKFTLTWFHRTYFNKLNDFANGDINKLMIFIPPQHGKSEGSTRRLPAYLLGRNPTLNIAIVSYNDTKARKFNREIKRIIASQEYKEVFPDIKLPSMLSGYTNSANEFELVGFNGSLKTVGIGGSLTGDPVDILIMDDLYKDKMSAWSEVVRQNVQDWYDTVADTRLHNDSQQLIVFTRWHHLDLAGYLLEKEPDEWDIVLFQAIKENNIFEYDTREVGEPLWKEKHSLNKLIKTRDRNPHVFQSLYQQNPKPLEGLLYQGIKVYKSLPNHGYIKNYTDTADQGSDYLCSISYIEHLSLKYIVDVYYTQKPNEITEPELSKRFISIGVNESVIESNNGGRAFARNIERISRELGNNKVLIKWFYQSNNKEARIKSNSSTVINTVIMPEDWHIKWPEFYGHVTNYLGIFNKNKYHDAADVLTGIVENVKSKPRFYN